MSHAFRYTLGGALLGLGAPAGALLIRVLGGATPAAELRAHAFFYIYELVGTCLVFSTVGFLAGRRADRFRKGRDLYRELSEHDPLTNLVNARAFWSRYERAVEHAERFREPLSLLLLDIDGLKAINDELGHAFGSAALRHVGRVLQESKRAEDTAARWGGDEFGILMVGAGREAARRQSEAIRERLGREPVRVEGRERPVAVTIGAATAEGGEPADLFEAADRALYEGKKRAKTARPHVARRAPAD
jgi:diguanylate cyclase (GGDEF)-like protein